MRRISDALEGGSALSSNDGLRELVEGDVEALAYAQDLVRIDEVLKSFGEATREPDWEALASRIEGRLDEELEPLEGIDDPPRFDDDAARFAEPPVEGSEVGLARPAATAGQGAREEEAAKVVPLRRKRSSAFVWLGGLAAAAAVGLGVAVGTATLESAEPTVASAPQPAAEMAAEVPATAEPTGAFEQASAEPEPTALPAAAAAQPLARAGGALEASETRAPARRARHAAPAASGRGGGFDSLSPSEHPAGGASVAGPAPPPPRPTRAEMVRSLHSVEPRVQRCLSDRGETAHAVVTVGADGSVASVRVAPPYAGVEARCIVDAVRTARMPESAEDYQLSYVFHPAPVAGGSIRPPAAARLRAHRSARHPAAERAADTDTP